MEESIELPKEERREAIQLFTDIYRELVRLNDQRADDRLKYSSWLLAVATAGIALSLTQVGNILGNNDTSVLFGKEILVYASVLFLISALVGATLRLLTNYQKGENSTSLTLILLQKIYMWTSEPDQAASAWKDMLVVYSHFMDGALLSAESQQEFRKSQIRSDRANKWSRWCLVAQQILIFAGYILVFRASMI